MARLDRLSGVKDVAHLAATLGRVFSHELLARASRRSTEAALEQALDQLVDAELIYRRGAPPEVDLRVQARAGPGRRLQQPAAQQAPAAAPADRRDPRGALSARRSRASPSCSPTTSARRACRRKAFPYAMQAGDAAVAPLRLGRGARPLPGGARPGALAAALGERLARADRGRPQARRASPQNRDHFEQRPEEPRAGARARGGAQRPRRRCAEIQYWIGRINYVFGRFDPARRARRQGAARSPRALGGDDTAFTADPVNLLGRIHCLRGEAPRGDHATPRATSSRCAGSAIGIEEAAMSGVLAFAYGMHGEFAEALRGGAARHRARRARSSICRPRPPACSSAAWSAAGTASSTTAVAEFEEALASSARRQATCSAST